MPPIRHIAREQPSPASVEPQRHFDFPSDSHLLITTASRIQAWDSTGLHTIFTSSKSGIVAAREAKDGSGILAVADKHVVVLHDTKRDQEQSWGLNANEDEEVRHLEYTQDAKCLFLSTSLTNDVQRYSVNRSRLLSPTQSHNSAPVALAVSPTGHLMVSASKNPPTVFLKNLALNSTPTLIEPRASDSAVCAAAFHPERPNIFLLAFRDGTLAAYDATKASRKQTGSYADQELFNDGEISHLSSLHRTTSKTVTRTGISSKTASVARAAFLQGYKTRAVSIGSDGRCRLVDFADGGIILRTWHAKAPLTSVSVLSIRTTRSTSGTHGRTVSASSYTIGGPTSTNNLIAVGRADGKVHIYDSVGILLAQRTVSDVGEKIIGVEWAKGPSPRPIFTGEGVRNLSDAPTLPLPVATPKRLPVSRKSMSVRPKSPARRGTTPHRLGLPPDLRRPDTSAQKRSARRDRKFTVHPDETEEGTVRHTPLPKHAHTKPAAGNYLDLFSPVKSPSSKPAAPLEKPTSPIRQRPRLSSQTFVKSEDAGTKPPNSAMMARKPELFPSAESHATSTGFSSETETSRAGKSAKGGRVRRVSTHMSPLKKRTTNVKPFHRPTFKPADNVREAAPSPNGNAKVLAGLRKMSGALPGGQQGSVLAPFANNNVAKSEIVTHLAAQDQSLAHAARKGIGKQRYWNPGNVLEREATWVTDSMQDISLHEDEDDIWLTSDTDKGGKHLRRRRLADMKRPPARQTSRSRADSKGTYSTLGKPDPTQATSGAVPKQLDGSTGDEQYGTAHTHLSPVLESTGDFVPSSADVRELFPRSSSLSPKRKRSPQSRVHKPSPKRERALQELAINTPGRQYRSPWARAEATKAQQSPTKLPKQKQAAEPTPIRNDSVLATAALVRSPTIQCFKCADTGNRIADLEDEVARLKGEVLAMKAAMRRNGVSLPASVRGLR